MAKSKSKKRRKIVIISIIVVALAVLAAVAVLKKKEVVLTVETEPVQRRDITEEVLADGRIHPVLQVKISPEVSGEIINLPVREGQHVDKGDLLVQIKPDFYQANVNRAKAGYEQALAGLELSKFEQAKAELEFQRVKEMYENELVSDSEFETARTSRDTAIARTRQSEEQVGIANASLASAREDLEKTTIRSPLSGTISKLNSELGERVLGTVQNMGTEIMVISDLDEMEARVEIGEIDIVLIKTNQIARLEVDAFRDREFTGRVTEIGNSAITSGAGSQQQATRFEVTIKINEKEEFRPGMSVSAYIETRYQTNVLSVPIQCVTRRMPKKNPEKETQAGDEKKSDANERNSRKSKPSEEKENEPIEVVFLAKDGKAVMAPVTRGISDDEYVEITEGLSEGDVVITGSYRAIDRDLEDGSSIRIKNKDQEKTPGES